MEFIPNLIKYIHCHQTCGTPAVTSYERRSIKTFKTIIKIKCLEAAKYCDTDIILINWVAQLIALNYRSDYGHIIENNELFMQKIKK